MLTFSKKNKIAPISIFYLLYISRMVVTLTDIQSLSIGSVSTDVLISLVLSLGITVLLSLPAIFCCRFNKNPFDVKWVGFFYSLYFAFLAGVNISRFSYFASTTLNPDSKPFIFALIIAVCAFYSACFGVEAIARFSSFAFILLILAVLAVFACNIKSFDEINLYPVIQSDRSDIIKKAFIFSSNTSEAAVFLCLNKKVNGNAIRPFVRAISAAYLTIFVLVLFVMGVLGAGASLQTFPIYTLFEMSKIGNYERLDVLHISFWILGVFLKSVLLTYCSAISVKTERKIKHSYKCLVSIVFTFALSLYLTQSTVYETVLPNIIMLPFLIFCVIIPICTLIFKKRNLGDELVEIM
ncbi:MAG: spore germination protein [Clostridiales bacterium]|nr:spore germination protein [Clostridiales bacterium]